MSNVLYRSSYIIKGNCRAVVCAVGENTQYGMAQEVSKDGTNYVEQTTPLRKLLEKYQTQVYQKTLYFVVFPILLCNRVLLYNQLMTDGAEKYQILKDMNRVMPLLI